MATGAGTDQTVLKTLTEATSRFSDARALLANESRFESGFREGLQKQLDGVQDALLRPEDRVALAPTRQEVKSLQDLSRLLNEVAANPGQPTVLSLTISDTFTIGVAASNLTKAGQAADANAHCRKELIEALASAKSGEEVISAFNTVAEKFVIGRGLKGLLTEETKSGLSGRSVNGAVRSSVAEDEKGVLDQKLAVLPVEIKEGLQVGRRYVLDLKSDQLDEVLKAVTPAIASAIGESKDRSKAGDVYLNVLDGPDAGCYSAAAIYRALMNGGALIELDSVWRAARTEQRNLDQRAIDDDARSRQAQIEAEAAQRKAGLDGADTITPLATLAPAGDYFRKVVNVFAMPTPEERLSTGKIDLAFSAA
jgi:hypothetical protein